MVAIDTGPNRKDSETCLVVRAVAVFLRRKGGGGPMPQLHLPMFSSAHVSEWRHPTSPINWPFMKKDGAVTCFNGHMPVLGHGESKINTFRMITSEFCVNGCAKQGDIILAFGVTSSHNPVS
jgi:hypothetical protein